MKISRPVFLMLILLILVFYFFASFYASTKESLTFDEIVYQEEGKNNIEKQQFSIDPYNPPLIREIQYLPTYLGFQNKSIQPNMTSIYPRVITIIFGLGTIILTMIYANKYFGKKTAIIAGLLLSLEPTFFANSHYVTPDIGLTFFVLLTIISFYRLLSTPSLSNFFFFGISFGLAAAGKVVAIPIVVLTIIVFFLLKRKIYNVDWHVSNSLKMFFAYFVSIFVIWSCYFFRATPILVKHDNPERLSNRIIALANERQLVLISQSIKILQDTPIPLGDYLAILKNNALRFKNNSATFFLGKYYEKVEYFMMPISFILKTPPPILILFIIGALFLIFSNLGIKLTEDQKNRISNDARLVPTYKLKIKKVDLLTIEQKYYLLIPIIVMFLTAMLMRMSPLVRYLLPMYPFICIVAGSWISRVTSFKYKLIYVILMCWYMTAVFLNYPHSISYTNIIIPKTERYLFFNDSNLDWGQGLISLREYAISNNLHNFNLSYFGRDRVDLYGFKSENVWGSYKNDEICKFRSIGEEGRSVEFDAISVSNWYNCSYYINPLYAPNKIKKIIGDSILIF